MISRAQVASSLSVAMVVGTLAVTTSPAGAEKPDRGCPPSFDEVGPAELYARFPVPGFDALFAFFDKNDDDVLCAKETPGVFNTIDNTANA